MIQRKVFNSIFFLLLAIFLFFNKDVLAKRAAIIVNYETNEVLFEVNADTLNYPASLAKIMTLYLTFEALEKGDLKWDQKLKVSKVAASRSPSKLYLEVGETITVEDAVMALVVKSANDVATVIAESLADSERDFAKKMTKKAREIGMKNTTYKNASGLPNRAQLTTARDTSILSRALIKNYPSYYELFKEKKFSWKDKKYKSHNKLMSSYDGADGIKTGYIYASGFQLAFSAVRNNTRLIGIYFGGDTAKHRDETLKFLMNKEFTELSEKKIQTNKQVSKENLEKNNQYKIIVGTFKYEKNAKKQIKIVKSFFPELLKNKDSRIFSRKGQNRTWYETQFIFFDKQEANTLCSLMKKNNIDCFVK